MILINKLQFNDNNKQLLFECLLNNLNISFISKIIIFHNNTNIILPENDKVKLVVKNGYTDKEIIEYCRRVYNDEMFIFSNPFIKFNNSLMYLEGNKSIKIDDDCYIINRNIELERGDNLADILRIDSSNNKISIERKNILIVDEKNNIISEKKLSRKKSILEKNKIKRESYLNKKIIHNLSNDVQKTKIKLDIIIVSVDYNDFLSITLKNTTKFSNVTVVTSPSDVKCQELCQEFGANCIITENMYENGAIFNKGKAINEGITSLTNPEWI
jgi:hypothetical protein